MADLQMVLSEATKLNQHITQSLKFSTYPEYNDLSGLDIDFHDGEQILIWDELRRIMDKLADVQEYISYLTRPITEVSRLRKGTAGKYQTTYPRPCCISGRLAVPGHAGPAFWKIISGPAAPSQRFFGMNAILGKTFTANGYGIW